MKFDGVSYHGNTMLSSFGSISVTKSGMNSINTAINAGYSVELKLSKHIMPTLIK